MFKVRSIKDNNLLVILNDIFQASLILYLAMIIIEQFVPGFFADYINFNIVLIITIISGGISLSFKTEEKKIPAQAIQWYHYLIIIILGLAGGGLIFIKFYNLDWLAYIISILSGLIIILVSYLILIEE